jgi:hypothetical protein
MWNDEVGQTRAENINVRLTEKDSSRVQKSGHKGPEAMKKGKEMHRLASVS